MFFMVCKVLRLANISVLSKLPDLAYYWEGVLDSSFLHASHGLEVFKMSILFVQDKAYLYKPL